MISSASLLLLFLTKTEALKKTLPASLILLSVILLQGFEVQLHLKDSEFSIVLNDFFLPIITLVFGLSSILFKKNLGGLALPLVFSAILVKYQAVIDFYTVTFLYWIFLISTKREKNRLELFERSLFPILLFLIHLIFKYFLVNTNSINNFAYFSSHLEIKPVLASLFFILALILIRELLRCVEIFIKRGEHSMGVRIVPLLLILLALKQELSYSSLNIDTLFFLFCCQYFFSKNYSSKEIFVFISLLTIASLFPAYSLWIAPLLVLFHPITSESIAKQHHFRQFTPVLGLILSVALLTLLCFRTFNFFEGGVAVIWILSLFNLSVQVSSGAREAELC